MLESLIFSLNATLPVFFVMLVGKLLNRLGLFSADYASMTDKFVFRAALPVLLFRDMASMDFRRDFDIEFVLFCLLVSVVMFLAIWGLSALFLVDKFMVGAFTQGSARGSAAILGIALATNIYGDSGYAPLMVLAAVPVFNIMSVVILSVSAKDRERKPDFTDILKGIITNPIILGIAAGLPFSAFGISIPDFVLGAVDSVAKTATPMALLSIGAAFSLSSARKKLYPSVAACVIKLLLLPAVFLPVAVMCGFSGSALVAIFVMLGSPATVTCYIMAKNMKNDYVLSSNIVMLSTLLSGVSVTFWVFVLKLTELI